jgi:glycosyltransferase involved in cell wall biosynthesis
MVLAAGARQGQGEGVSRIPVTCTIIAKDEADRIGRCIASVRDLVEDVVVIDSGSSDDTAAIAQSLGARVVHNPWPGYGPQKRFAEDQAQHDWILNLDADEWLPPEARAEVASFFAGKVPDLAGYRFRLKTVYPHRDAPRPFADYHAYVRLYDRRRCRFPDSLAFDAIPFDRETMRDARAPIYHQTIRSLTHLLQKNKRYFLLQSVEISRPKWKALLRLPFEPLAVFLKYYLLRRHVTGGFFGLRFAATIAWLRVYRQLALAGFFPQATRAMRQSLSQGARRDEGSR